MILSTLFGRTVALTVRRFGPPGAFLAIDAADLRPEAPVLLLPRNEVPPGIAEGDPLNVFVYADSEDRPIATLHPPKVTLGEVAFLEVTQVTKFGAFVDWGLRKELLVPFAEQITDMRPGERFAVGLFLDSTGRLAGTTRVAEMLRDTPQVAQGEWIEGEAWRNDPDIGLFAILERSFVGLVPASEPHSLRRGESARFRVATILPDGKIELSLRGLAHEEVEADARKILQFVSREGAPKVGDRTSPDDIRRHFGLSKKAFKRAAGHLLKQRLVTFGDDGFIVAVKR